MNMDFTPESDLEQKLLLLIKNSYDFSEFINIFINEDVAILAQNPPIKKHLITLSDVLPLIIRGESKMEYIVVLTSKKMSDPLNEFFQDYPVSLTLPAKDLFLLLPNDIGIVINPGSPLEKPISPETTGKIKSQLQEIRKKFT